VQTENLNSTIITLLSVCGWRMCFLRWMRTVLTHDKLRHVCATQSIGTRLNIVILCAPSLCRALCSGPCPGRAPKVW
jgi:hypothetical protein